MVESGRHKHTSPTHPSPYFSLSVARTLRSIAAALRDALTKGRPLTEAAAVEGYGAVVAVIDGAANEGVVEAGAPGGGRAARVRGVE